MGTRNLTAVVVDGEMKIAQYGQWDGYPSGTGLDVLNFLYKVDVEDFANKIRSLRWYTEEEHGAALESVGSTNGMLNMEQSDEYAREYPELSRDTGSKILNLVAEGGVSTVTNHEDFALDGLFCEYAYVVDLDRSVFECYKGFQKSGSDIKGRWKGKQADGSDYAPVTLIAEFKLSELPTNEEFLAQLEPEEDEDE